MDNDAGQEILLFHCNGYLQYLYYTHLCTYYIRNRSIYIYIRIYNIILLVDINVLTKHSI